MALLAVFAVPVVLRQLFGRRTGPRDPYRRLGADVGWALASGLAFAGIATFYLSGVHLDAPLSAPDFYEYCTSVIHLGGRLDVEFADKRSRVAALLPALFARRYGVIDGLALGAIVSSGVLGAGLYVWGRALAGRAAGLASVAVGLAVGPLAVLPRNVSFYPEIVAGLVLAAGTTAAAITRPRLHTALACGIACGLALLLDVRGVIWALPFVATALFAALIGKRSWPGKAALVVALLLPVWGSWFAGPYAYRHTRQSLELQMDIRPWKANEPVELGPAFDPPYEVDSWFIWGRAHPRELLGTARFFLEQREYGKILTAVLPIPAHERRHTVDPWLAALALAGPALLILRIRRWRVVLAALVTTAPFLLSLHAAATFRGIDARFLAHSLPAVAVVVGAALGSVLRVIPAQPWWRLPSPLRAAALAGLLWVALAGIVPSWFGPYAPWRRPVDAVTIELDELPRVLGAGRPVEAAEPRLRMMRACACEVMPGCEPLDEVPLRVFDRSFWLGP